MQKWKLLAAALVLIPLGCQRDPPEVKSARTEPFLAPSDVQRMPVEERDDPYTRMHVKPEDSRKP